MKKIFAALCATAVMAAAANVQAAPIAYPTPGVANPISYVFTAATPGNVVAYFAGSGAAYTNEISLLVNGVDTGIVGLSNVSSAFGDQLNFGSVNAGDTLVFKLINTTPGNIGPWYSQQSLNADGVNHIYSSLYGGDALIPAGIYVAFEDLPNGGDFSYFDENFVFANVAATNVPEPGSLALLGLGIAGLAAARRQRAKTA